MNGILLIDKQGDMTSRDVVDRISHILKIKKIGHTGTLDPTATGVLVLCIGDATKIAEIITGYDKKYIAEVTLGIETDTLDITGEVIKEINDIKVTKGQVENALKMFVGEITQEVPKYSAIKINGRRLYSYTRRSIDIDLPKRNVNIYNLELLDDIFLYENKVKFKIECHVSKGTYIRSLIKDIGIELGVPATMSALRRISQGEFEIKKCYTLKDIEDNQYKMLDIKEVLKDIEEITVAKKDELKIMNGNIIDRNFDSEMVKIMNEDNELIALYQVYDKDSTKAKPYKMFKISK